ncbi:MAG: hypothetical protein M1820_004651 [Bogoriella megaspora]|nr:MAG: hypothetical protein M1820_004651 [Bogoriella megaspora]
MAPSCGIWEDFHLFQKPSLNINRHESRTTDSRAVSAAGDNGACLDTQYNLLSAGSCTDKSYESLNCFQFCKDPTFAWTDLIQNFNTTGFCCHYYEDVDADNDHLCMSNSVDSNATRPAFNPAVGKIITDRVNGSTAVYNSTSPAPQNLSNADASTPQCSPGKEDNSKEVAIGAGIGVPLGVAFIAALLMWWFERRKLLRERAQWAEAGAYHYTSMGEQKEKNVYAAASVPKHEMSDEGARHELSGETDHLRSEHSTSQLTSPISPP